MKGLVWTLVLILVRELMNDERKQLEFMQDLRIYSSLALVIGNCSWPLDFHVCKVKDISVQGPIGRQYRNVGLSCVTEHLLLSSRCS